MNAPTPPESTVWQFATRAIHAGNHPDPATGAIMPPIFATSTYVQEAPAVTKGYDYSRSNNPTRERFEQNLASLEGGSHGLAFASGLAAIATIINLLRQGDHVVCGNDLYGGTYRLFTQLFAHYGLSFSFVDSRDPACVSAALTPHTRLVFIETPTNPLLGISDIAALAQLAHGAGAWLAVDNTFASPVLQSPLALGADFAVHSCTKYLGGHSDLVGGALVVVDDALAERLRFYQNAAGAVPSPFDCFLLLRSTKTLELRVSRACENARQIVAYLAGHPRVTRVYYPGLADHPGHELAKRQMRDFGAMISCELEGGVEAGKTVCVATRLFALAESLGGVESLIEHPASMTHASIPAKERHAAGLADGLIRLSVGVEHVADLIADLDQALASL